MKRGNKLFTTLAALVLISSMSAMPSLAMADNARNRASGGSEMYNVYRIAGSSRYDTSFNILKKCESYGGNLNGIIIMVGDDWKTGVSLSALAGVVNAPILIVEDGESTVDTDAKIAYIKSQIKNGCQTYVVGSATKTGAYYADKLSKFTEVKNIDFSNYNELSLKIKEEATRKDVIINSAVVVTSLLSADAVSVIPYIWNTKSLVFFTNEGSNELAPSTINLINSLNVSKGYIIGGVSVVSNTAELTLNTNTSLLLAFERVWGNDRYATNQMVISKMSAGSYYNADPVLVAGSLIDGISAGVYSGITNKILVLIDETWGNNSYSQRSLLSYTFSGSHAIIIGGEGVIPASTADAINSCITGHNPYI